MPGEYLAPIKKIKKVIKTMDVAYEEGGLDNIHTDDIMELFSYCSVRNAHKSFDDW